ncbi:serine/threonine-protein kinase [Paraconexibacter sp.]|uniref:serine/threonine-protein kinase n=1 Tax=Paraconexibacter sp. TaxID=2949640 RepID=UPI00356AA6F2
MRTAPQNDPDTLAAPAAETVLGRYRLGRRLGAGGMGVVFVAHDEHLDRAVAVKRIDVGDPGIAKRAEREGKAAARLQHPGIVALHEAGRDGDTVYLVSELVRGHTLRDLLDDGALSDRAVLRIGVALCDALTHAHKRGVVHRDVKPGNVLVPARPTDAGGVAKLTDFGVAWMAGDDALTRTGDVVGTLAYMAPEQAEGREVTPATDLYALALVLYEALCGVNPVRGAGVSQTARKVGRRLPALGRLRRDLPLDLCGAIDTAVRPDPSERGTIDDLCDALEDALEDADDEPGTIAGAPTEVLGRVVDRDAYREPVRPSARLVSGLAAGILAGAALQWLGPPAPVPVLAGAGAVAGAVILLPRLGFLAVVAALVLWLAGEAPGLAAFVALAGLPVAVLVRRAPNWWCSPAMAAGLGLGGVALGGVAVVGQAPRPLQRFALGVLSCWWLVLAEAMSGERLLFGAPASVAPAGSAEGSAGAVLRDVAWPLLTSGVLLVGLLWGAAALALPHLVRGRVAAVDMVAATAWAAGLATATQALGGVLTGWGEGPGAPEARGIVAGAALAGVLAVGVRATSGPSRSGDETRSLA